MHIFVCISFYAPLSICVNILLDIPMKCSCSLADPMNHGLSLRFRNTGLNELLREYDSNSASGKIGRHSVDSLVGMFTIVKHH